MKRRDFIRSSSLLGLTPAIPYTLGFQKSELQKPMALKPGSTIGLITPAGALSRSAFEKSLLNMDELGYKVKYSGNILTRSGFLAGTDQQRIDDIHQMFSDPEISAIFCARGGYGTTRLLDRLDFELIGRNPKPFIGYSDITALHCAFYNHCGLVGFHGPVGASTMNDFTVDYLIDTVVKGKNVKIKANDTILISGGSATGRLVGGNLSLLTSLLGTRHDINYADHIVFIEEIGESAYRVDRMLTQLLSAQKFEGVKGIVLGYFTDCDAREDDPYYEFSIGINEIFKDRLGSLGIPVVGGFPFGHEAHNATLPIGILAELQAEKGVLKLLESAVL